MARTHKKSKKRASIGIAVLCAVMFISGLCIGIYVSDKEALLGAAISVVGQVRENLSGAVDETKKVASDAVDAGKNLTKANNSDKTETVNGIELNGPYDVIRVVDGDTLVLSIDGEDKRVRLIGVDTPESVHSNKSKNTEECKEASKWTNNLLTGRTVYIEYDVSPTDRYDRILAYVYLDDKVTMVNRMLLENGLATVMTVQPNSKYADEFYEIQVNARDAGVGFWETGFFKD